MPESAVLLRMRRRPMMKKLLVVLALSGGLVLSACSTLRGAANDVESVTDCADGKPGNC
jgi:predicted small secreted protein